MCTSGTEHLTVTEFQGWLATAQPGERVAYAKGALAASIHTAWQSEHPDTQKLSALQEATWRAGAKGHVISSSAGSSGEVRGSRRAKSRR